MKTQHLLLKKAGKRIFRAVMLLCILTFLFATPVFASENGNENTATTDVTTDTVPFEIGVNLTTNGEPTGLATTLQILLVITIIALAPSILILLTSFTRIIIIFHFVRSALTTQTTPPNQVLIGLALFLTFFIMAPVFSEINTEAIQPLSRNEITLEEAFDRGVEPLRQFMYKHAESKDIKLFVDIAKLEEVNGLGDIPTSVLIPAFIIGELRAAFIMGFVIYVPFLIIDMIVASTLMSMGMMMLPPTTISMPFKILLFIMVDGWSIIIKKIVEMFMT